MKDYGDFAIFHLDVFADYFKPYRPIGTLEEQYFGDFELQPERAVFNLLKEMDQRTVWTIIEDGSSRDLYFSPGFRVVNRVGYAVTLNPHNFAPLEFCAYWPRYLSEPGLRSEVKKLRRFLARIRADSTALN